MKKVKFFKEPGYVYDLFFLFVLNFNKDYCFSHFINYDQSSADAEYFNKLLLDYEEISKDLLLFFHVRENGLCFMTQYYFENNKMEFAKGYNLAAVQNAVSNHDQVIANVLQFYFPDADAETHVKCKSSISEVGQLIRDSEYSDAVKSSLYAFFIQPNVIIQKLYYELMKKENQLAQQYEKRLREIVEIQSQIDIEEISEKLKMCKIHSCDLSQYDEIGISLCLANKNCLRYILTGDSVLLIMGVNYLATLDYCIMQNRAPELDVFGNAIAEKNRVEILNLIWQKKEITVKDIEQELKFTGTNAYYHLTLMIRANMISSRNQGRVVLYSINKQYFHVVSEMLNKYAE